MSNKRVGFADRAKRERLNVLFTPSNAQAVIDTDEEVEVSKTEVKKEAIKNKSVEKKTETKSTKEPKEKKEEKRVIRQTYYLTPELIEALKIINFDTREGISAIVNRILNDAIPSETIKQAKKNIGNIL